MGIPARPRGISAGSHRRWIAYSLPFLQQQRGPIGPQNSPRGSWRGADFLLEITDARFLEVLDIGPVQHRIIPSNQHI